MWKERRGFHLADFLPGAMYALGWLLHLPIVFKYRKREGEEQGVWVRTAIPRVFLVLLLQFVNFPITAGVSWHFVGFVVLASLPSFFVRYLALWSVLVIQAFLLQDGGLLSLSWNVLIQLAGVEVAAFLLHRLRYTRIAYALAGALGYVVSVVVLALVLRVSGLLTLAGLTVLLAFGAVTSLFEGFFSFLAAPYLEARESAATALTRRQWVALAVFVLLFAMAGWFIGVSTPDIMQTALEWK